MSPDLERYRHMTSKLSLLALVAAAALPGAAGAQQPVPPATGAAMSAAPATPVDDAAAVDAEMRIALFDLLAGKAVPALGRLQWLASTAPAVASKNDLSFLLAQAEYRFGMDSAFRATATQLVGGVDARRAGLLRNQLLLSAYRAGDYRGAMAMADANASSGSDAGLSALVSGLAAYQMKDFAKARASFAGAAGTGSQYASYARYMDALTTLSSDTLHTKQAVAQLEQLAGTLQGDFADQVRLTAAQVAYQNGAWADAARLAGAVASSSPLSAQATLTKGWAQYKADQVADAGATFMDFATRFPELPERDESRLMAAQSYLQLGRTDDAAALFKLVTDSSVIERQFLQGGAQEAISATARSLVTARAAGVLYMNSPELGKTITLDDGSLADGATLAAAVGDGSTAPAAGPRVVTMVSMHDVSMQLDSLKGVTAPRRVIFAASNGASVGAYALGASAVHDADADVAVSAQQLATNVRAYRQQLALLGAVRDLLAERRGMLTATATSLADAQRALTALNAQLDAATQRIRTMFLAQTAGVRSMSQENLAAAQGMQATAATLAPDQQGTISLEVQTAQSYAATASMIETNFDNILKHHPVFVLRDSVRARSERVASLLTETQASLASTERLVGDELTNLQNNEPDALKRARAQIAAAQARRTAAETRLVGVVETELRARSTEMLADLTRDAEAAEFGTASTSFFKAIDQKAGAGSRIGAAAAPATAPSSPAPAGAPTSKKQ